MLVIVYKEYKKPFKENNLIKALKIEYQLLRYLKLFFIFRRILNGNSIILTASLLKETG